MSRDRDVRMAIRDALEATDMFGIVSLKGLPEDWGYGASIQAAAVIEPMSSTETSKWDNTFNGELIVESKITVTFMVRLEDPEDRDAAVEQLFDTAANTLNGQSLAGLTLQPFTRFTSWRWEKAKPPERRITSIFGYTYLVSTWNSFDTTE